MELIYLWIDGYKNLKNTGIILNPAYKEILFEEELSTENIKNICLEEKTDYINIFGENLNVTTIVGKNGSGKSNIVNILSYILRSISNCYHTKFYDENEYDDNNIPKSCSFCLIIKNNNKYAAYCSDNCINNVNVEIKIKYKESPLIAEYSDHINNENILFKKKRLVQAEHKKINVAKFQPFYRKDDTNPVSFTQNYGINEITKIKLVNYFYYDRFRLYDTVRNLMEFYTFDNQNKLNIFKGSNKRLRFNKYSPYIDIVDALQWANNRVQRTKDEPYEITSIISDSAGQLSRHMNAGKNIEEVIDNVLPKLFFIYALGEILEINKNRKYKDDLRKLLIAPFEDKYIRNLNYDDYEISSNRVEFYKECIKRTGDKRLKNMFSAYIRYETGQVEKNILRKYYTIKGNILRLENPIDYNDIKNKTRVKKIETLKGIGKNLYMNDIYDFMGLSTGEQRLMRFFADVYYCAAKLKNNYETNVFIFDEMDLSWHPEWQRKMIYYIKDLFDKISQIDENKDRKFNLIFTTHSPFILSDMPKDNIVFMENGENITHKVNLQPFGANIHDLFNCGLFFDCKDCGNIGEFAKDIIQNDIMKNIKNLNEGNQKEIEYKISLIGEPLLRNAIWEKLYFNNNYKTKVETPEYLKAKIKKLTQRINELENKNEKD